jgi:glycosyltransferase involved in cell wall biosynthesis
MRIAIITAHSPLARAGHRTGRLDPVALVDPASLVDPVALARGLAGLGHRVTLYARTEDAAAPRTAILGAGVSVEHISVGPARELTAEHAAKYMPEMAVALADRWRAKSPDVVHAFSWTAGLAAIGAVRGTSIPVVQTFGSLASIERRQARSGVSAARIRLEGSMGRTVATVLAASQEEAAELSRLGVPRSVIRAIPAGVDTTVFCPPDVRAGAGSSARLVAVADDQARGLQSVIRALPHLPAAELTIAGGPDARHMPRSGPFRELVQLATTLRVRDRVTFAGELADADLAELLRTADVMVSATAYAPAGQAVVQAMACGIPVVASAVGGQRDAVVDGITGLLVAPDRPAMLVQRLRALLARPAMLQAYGIAAADRARSRYAIDRVSRETAAAYDRCLRTSAADVISEDESDEAEDLRDAQALAFA